MRRAGRLLACLCAAALAAAPAWASEKQLKEAELAKLRSKIGNLRQSLDDARGRLSLARKELREIEQRAGRLNRNIRSLDASIAEQRKHLSRLQKEQTELNASVRRQRSQLAAQLRASHAMGRQEYLKLVLNQEDPAALGRVVAYYDYMNRSRAERISELLATVARLQTLSQELTAEAANLEKSRTQRAAELKRLQADKKQRSVLLVQLRQEITTKDEQLKQFLADERDLVHLLEVLADVVQDLPFDQAGRPFAQLKGRLNWPTRGAVAASFGSDRAHGRLRWQGVLIRAPEGQEVKAVSHGRVAFAEWLRGYGLLLILDHGGGYMSLYGHNQTLLKEVGDWVQAGDTIGTVGDSGGSENAGLYFEIRHNGKPQDPGKWVGSVQSRR